MDLKNIRFDINPDMDRGLSEILVFFQFFEGKKFNDMEYDAVKNNGLGIEKSLLIVTLDRFENLISHFKPALDNLIHVGQNKILVLGSMDSEYLWRFNILHRHGSYLNSLFPNILRTSDTPNPVDQATALSVHSPFIANVDLQGLHLINRNLENRKNFFCLMNRRRPHRNELMAALKKYDLFNKGLVVYHEFQHYEAFPGLHDQPKFSDLTDFNPAQGVEWKDFKMNRYYNEYLIELVTETRFEFVSPTEKIMKPIAAGMPFLVVGSPGLLAYLRNLGFKTYHEFFDESYNDEYDMIKQCDKVCNLLKHLIENNLLENIYKSSQHIVDHNREILARIHAKYYSQQFENIVDYIKRI